MSDPTDKPTPEELEEFEKVGSLSDELAERWDPEKLLKLVAFKAGRGEQLDASTRSKFEAKLGVDLGRVRLYTGEFAEGLTKAHGAEALTIGNTGMVVMGSHHSMATTAGQALLAHELTHVAQSQRGVHRQATFGAMPALANEEAEEEAEAAAAEEEHGQSAQAPDAESAQEQKEAAEEKIRERVFELISEELIAEMLRNGDGPYRP